MALSNVENSEGVLDWEINPDTSRLLTLKQAGKGQLETEIIHLLTTYFTEQVRITQNGIEGLFYIGQAQYSIPVGVKINKAALDMTMPPSRASLNNIRDVCVNALQSLVANYGISDLIVEPFVSKTTLFVVIGIGVSRGTAETYQIKLWEV